jgi:hypothetical protein
MFKLESEPWIKADMENGSQMTPILTWGTGQGDFIHLVKDDHEYQLVWGIERSTSPEEPHAYLFEALTHWPKEVLKDIVERYPLED